MCDKLRLGEVQTIIGSWVPLLYFIRCNGGSNPRFSSNIVIQSDDVWLNVGYNLYTAATSSNYSDPLILQKKKKKKKASVRGA
jgi:hypothetical protein